MAVRSGRLAVVRGLVLDFSADVLVPFLGRHTALCYVGGHVDILDFLLVQCAARGQKTTSTLLQEPCAHKTSLLRYAVSQSQLGMVQYLVREKGADPLRFTSNEEASPDLLPMMPHHEAAKNGDVAILKWLLEEAKVPVDALDGDGGSVLHHLCGEIGADERLPILKYLVEDCGADLDTINNYGLTAMNLAHLRGNASLVEYLAPRSRENFMVGFREGRKAQQTGARMFISFIISVKQIRMHSPDAYNHSTQDVMRDFELLGEERLLHADKSSQPRKPSSTPVFPTASCVATAPFGSTKHAWSVRMASFTTPHASRSGPTLAWSTRPFAAINRMPRR